MADTLVPAEDLDAILGRSGNLLEELSGQRLFLTGCTGFFGLWLLATIAAFNRDRKDPVRVVALSRDPDVFAKRYPVLWAPWLTLVGGDIRSFTLPRGRFDAVIHGATTSARETFNQQDPLQKFDIVAGGTRQLLAQLPQGARLLYLGSGACYGRQPDDLLNIPED